MKRFFPRTSAMLLIVTILSFSLLPTAAYAAPNFQAAACTPFALNGPLAGTTSTGTGSATVLLNMRSRTLTWDITFQGLSGAATAAHFHGPALPGQNAGIVVPIDDLSSPSQGSATLTDDQIVEMMNGLWYINIHTAANPGGEIRGQVVPCQDPAGPALPKTFPLDATQAGTNSSGSGSGVVIVDVDAQTITYNIIYAGLTGAPNAGHFHGPALPGQNAPIVLDFANLTSPIEGTSDLTDEELLQVLNGQWYANIHTAAFPAGEIRGQSTPNIFYDFDACLGTPFPIDGAQAGTNATATGTGLVTLNAQTRELTWNFGFTGLSGDATAAHFHGPAAPGANAGVVLPFTDLTSPIEGAQILTPEQADQVNQGLWYVNIHTAANPNGEIRGQVTACTEDPFLSYFPTVNR